MSSNVFYKFTSQREPSRVTFDGTSISVWELKRDIITQSRLGDGTDFDLILTNPDTNEEYDDDTTQISRSTSVTAKRGRPLQGHGKGRAARYLTGKMPTFTKTALKTEQAAYSTTPSSTDPQVTEDEAIAAMHKRTGEQWELEKNRMLDQPKAARSGAPRRQTQNAPDNPPPVGYICHRCRKPGHYIQACPTNNDAKYDNGPRVKRTTGIPRSFLRTVQEDTDSAEDGLTTEKKTPSNIMVNAEGQRVEAVPDVASWEQYRAKADAAAANKQESVADSKELEERGLACPIDKQLFVEPCKTPCCGRTYCHRCIESALFDSDFVCPNCGEQALCDDLKEDEDMMTKVREYEYERSTKTKEVTIKQSRKSSSSSSIDLQEPQSPQASAPNPKKRGAESELPNGRQKTRSLPGSKPQSPKVQAVSSATSPEKTGSPAVNASVPTGPKANRGFEEQMNELTKHHTFNNETNGMPLSNDFNPYAMPGMPPMMGGMSDPAMMQMMQHNMNQFAMGMTGMPNMMPGNNAGMNFNQPGMGMTSGWDPNGPNNNNLNNQGIPTGPKAQRPPFSHQQASRGGDGDAYMRKPLNPNRAPYRTRRTARPMDFKEV